MPSAAVHASDGLRWAGRLLLQHVPAGSVGGDILKAGVPGTGTGSAHGWPVATLIMGPESLAVGVSGSSR